MARYMRDYRAKRREEALRRLGGKCVVCGSTTELEFDHIDPATKSFALAGWDRPWSEIERELEKCQLLCNPHHEEKTKEEQTGVIKTVHGTSRMFRHGCKCAACREARRLETARYRARKKLAS